MRCLPGSLPAHPCNLVAASHPCLPPAVFYQHTAGDGGPGGPPLGEGTATARVLRDADRPEHKYAETLQVGSCQEAMGGLGGGWFRLHPDQHAHGYSAWQQAGLQAGHHRQCLSLPHPAPQQAVEELLVREADPPGERYSLSKVLHTCQVRGRG